LVDFKKIINYSLEFICLSIAEIYMSAMRFDTKIWTHT